MMKSLFVLLLCCALASQVQAQTYRAKDISMRTREVPVPEEVVKAFKKTYSGARIDSCLLYVDEGEEEYTFYSHQQGRLLEVDFDQHGKFVRSTAEVPVEELPEPLQQSIAQNSIGAESIGRVFKVIGHRKNNEPEYMVECFREYSSGKLKIPMYFNAEGYGAPGFR